MCLVTVVECNSCPGMDVGLCSMGVEEYWEYPGEGIWAEESSPLHSTAGVMVVPGCYR